MVQVHALNKQSYQPLEGAKVGIQDGVVFLTYASLAASDSSGLSRLQQLVDWAGEMLNLLCRILSLLESMRSGCSLLLCKALCKASLGACDSSGLSCLQQLVDCAGET